MQIVGGYCTTAISTNLLWPGLLLEVVLRAEHCGGLNGVHSTACSAMHYCQHPLGCYKDEQVPLFFLTRLEPSWSRYFDGSFEGTPVGIMLLFR